MGAITIKNGRLLSPCDGLYGSVGDIVIRYGRIAAIGSNLTSEGKIIDATDLYVTPGFIDMHTHVYPASFLGVEPDTLGLERGATTVIDAGSSGSDSYEDFKTYIDKAQTKVYTLLNIGKEGLLKGHELDDPSKIDIEACIETAKKYPTNIVGIKARASASVVGSYGIHPIAIAVQVAHKLGLPLVVHIGNQPPRLDDVLNLLEKDDCITHTYHGKPGGIIKDGNIIPHALRARKRGVRFDVGHGADSFSFDTYQMARALDFNCDTISTDLHAKNYTGIVQSLPAVMSKLITLGEPLSDAITKVTSAPARLFGLKGLGHLKPGMVGDVNVVELSHPDNEEVLDSTGASMRLTCKLTVVGSVYSRIERTSWHGF